MKLREIIKSFKVSDAELEEQHKFYEKKINSKEYKDLQILAQCMDQYFPLESLDVNLINEEHLHKNQSSKVYTSKYLPLHTNDTAWLMKYVYKVAKKYQGEDYEINPKTVKDFVCNNVTFQQKRSCYEQRLTALKIISMMESPFLNVFVRGEGSPFFNKNLINYDALFRQEVINTLVKMGFDKHNVELSLEKHADLWRKQAMIISFENKYYPISEIIATNEPFDKWWARLAKFKQKHQEVWLKRHEFNYYFDHKNIIDEAGCATPNMKMDIKQVTMVDAKLMRMENQLKRILASKDKLRFVDRFKGMKKSLTQNQDDSRTI